jgi:uncharacterized protein with HEPN domain
VPLQKSVRLREKLQFPRKFEGYRLLETLKVSKIGLTSPDEYFKSNLVFDATLMNFINIGEMVDRLPKELKDRHLGLDWQKMKDFRNLVAHDYLGVDAEEVWQIIKNDLPILRSELHKILSDLK